MSANEQTVPTILPVNIDGIPESLRAKNNWVAWMLRFRRDRQGSGKWTKPPFQASSNVSRYAKSTDPKTWAPFPLAMLSLRTPGVAGIGYVFDGKSRIVGIDIDHCRDPQTGCIDPSAAEIRRGFTNTYCEISPSATGVHIYARAQLPENAAGLKKGPIEIYPHSRFFA